MQVRILRELKEHPSHSPKNAHDDPAAITGSPAPSSIPPLPPPAYPHSPEAFTPTELHPPLPPTSTQHEQEVGPSRAQQRQTASSGSGSGSIHTAGGASSASSSFVLPDIAAHHHDRFAYDCQLDNADLRRIIKEAMDANSDDRLIEVCLLS